MPGRDAPPSWQGHPSGGGRGDDDEDGNFPRRGGHGVPVFGDGASPPKPPSEEEQHRARTLESIAQALDGRGPLGGPGGAAPPADAAQRASVSCPGSESPGDAARPKPHSAPGGKYKIDKTNVWCRMCGVTQSPQWRTRDGLIVCNACGMKVTRNAENKGGASKRQAAAHSREPSVAPSAGAGGGRKRTSKYDPDRWCRNCGAVTSPQWRSLANLTVCNACGIKSKRNPSSHVVRNNYPTRPEVPKDKNGVEIGPDGQPLDSYAAMPRVKSSKSVSAVKKAAPPPPRPPATRPVTRDSKALAAAVAASTAAASTAAAAAEDDLEGEDLDMVQLLMGLSASAPNDAPARAAPSERAFGDRDARNRDSPGRRPPKPAPLPQRRPTKRLSDLAGAPVSGSRQPVHVPVRSSLVNFNGPKSIAKSMADLLDEERDDDLTFELSTHAAAAMLNQVRNGGCFGASVGKFLSADGATPEPPPLSRARSQSAPGARKRPRLDDSAGPDAPAKRSQREAWERDRDRPAFPMPPPGSGLLDGDGLSPAEATYRQQYDYLKRTLTALHRQGHIERGRRGEYLAAWKRQPLEAQGRWYAELWAAVEAGDLPATLQLIEAACNPPTPLLPSSEEPSAPEKPATPQSPAAAAAQTAAAAAVTQPAGGAPPEHGGAALAALASEAESQDVAMNGPDAERKLELAWGAGS